MNEPRKEISVQHSGRIVLFALLIICNLGLIADLAQRGLHADLLVTTEIVRILFYLGCANLLHRAQSNDRSLAIVTAFTLAQAVFAGVIGDLRGMPNTILLGNGSLCLATAALVPWGWRRQIVLGGSAFAVWISLSLVQGSATYGPQSALLLGLLVVCSIAIAIETHRDRLDFSRRLESAQTARAQLRSLNLELEERISQRTRQLEETAAELFAFCQAVSHDLRPPLRTIDGFSGLLLEAAESSIAKQDMQSIEEGRRAAQALGENIDELLIDVRDAQQLLTHAPINLSELVAASLQTLKSGEASSKLQIEVEADLTILGDSDAYIDLVDELCLRSWLEVAHAHAPRIRFGARTLENGRRAFFIEDNGKGLDAASGDLIDQITGPGNSHDGTSGEAETSTGLKPLGIARARRTLLERGGQLWASSAVGGGTTLFFTVGDADDTALITAGARQ